MTETVAHHNVTLMTTDDKVSMDAVLADPVVRSIVWKRLDDTHALVDTERTPELVQLLANTGYAPRFARMS